MDNQNWIPLQNYSVKYGVSLSTLRRRIKAETIKYKFEAGKYLLADDDNAEPSPQIAEKPQVNSAAEIPAAKFVEASVLTSANRLVEEIKSAYAKILQEKEEQITQLKEEIVDLRMLVRILEESTKKTGTTEAAPDSFLFGEFQSRDI